MHTCKAITVKHQTYSGFSLLWCDTSPPPQPPRKEKKILILKSVKRKFSILANALLLHLPSAIVQCTHTHTHTFKPLYNTPPPFAAMHYCRDLSPISPYNTEVIIYIHFRKQQHRLALAYANIKLGKIWVTQRTSY